MTLFIHHSLVSPPPHLQAQNLAPVERLVDCSGPRPLMQALLYLAAQVSTVIAVKNYREVKLLCMQIVLNASNVGIGRLMVKPFN